MESSHTDIVSGGASIYTPVVDSSYISSVGVWAGTYVLDYDAWTLKTSSQRVGGIPVYLENDLDLVLSDIDLSDGNIQIGIDISEYASTSWDVDIFVNGVLASNMGTGAYVLRVDSTSSSFDVKIKAHVATMSHVVYFETFGGDEVGSLSVFDGGTIENRMPNTPRLSGHSFGGWYEDRECINEFNVASRITSDTILYAKWDENGDNARLEIGSNIGRVSATIHKTGDVIQSGQLIPKGTVIDLRCDLASGWEFLYWQLNGTKLQGSEQSFTITEDSIIVPILRYTSQSNALTNIIDVRTPTYGEDVMLLWSRHYNIDASMGVWSGFPSVPAIMGDSVYIRASDTLYKYKLGDMRVGTVGAYVFCDG